MAVADLAYKIVGLTVIVIMIAVLVIPVVDDLQNQTVEANNTGYRYLMEETTSEITVTLTADGFTVGTTAYDKASFNGYYIAIASDVILVFSGNSTTSTLQLIDLGTVKLTNISTVGSTVTFNNGSYSLTISGTTTTGDYVGNLKILASFGSYGIFRSGDLFFNDDSRLMFFNNNNFTVSGSTVNIRGIVEGTASSLQYLSAINTSASPMAAVTTSDLAVSLTSTITEVDKVAKSLSSFDLAMSYTVSGTAYSVSTTDATYYIAEVEYDKLAAQDQNITLLGIIPVMLIIVAVMFAVALMRGKS